MHGQRKIVSNDAAAEDDGPSDVGIVELDSGRWAMTSNARFSGTLELMNSCNWSIVRLRFPLTLSVLPFHNA